MSINVYPVPITEVSDPWIEHAKRIIFADYGVNVSLEAKNKDLLKFGRSTQVQTTSTTLMTLPAGTFNETYVSSNLITSIISTNAGDTQQVVVEGHTISGTALTFVTQTVTLTGQTVVTLPTAMARCNRIYNNGSTNLAGTISVCQNTTYAAGVPAAPALVHCQVVAGDQQSKKSATSTSSVDYWVVTSYYADMLEKTAASADVDLEIRLAGKVFRQRVNISVSENHRATFEFKPYLIIPPNSDIRLVARASANNKDISGGIEGVLLKA